MKEKIDGWFWSGVFLQLWHHLKAAVPVSPSAGLSCPPPPAVWTRPTAACTGNTCRETPLRTADSVTASPQGASDLLGDRVGLLEALLTHHWADDWNTQSHEMNTRVSENIRGGEGDTYRIWVWAWSRRRYESEKIQSMRRIPTWCRW